MEEFLVNLFDQSELPIWSAFLLGLLTAISPCPMATNITAVGYISKDIESRNRVFVNGLIYTLGRIFSYTALALLIYYGADLINIPGFFKIHGEKILGPIMLIVGVFMLDLIPISFPSLSIFNKKFENQKKRGFWQVFALGAVFALAFCPYSGAFYFGMLIPLTLSAPSGMVLPVVYAVATALPVIIIAWLIAYTVSGVGTFYNKIQVFEKWFRRVISILFIGVGVFYTYYVFFS